MMKGNVLIKIEDLPRPEQDLTPELAEMVMGGGGCIEVPTQTGTLDKVAMVSRTDYVEDYQCDNSYGVIVRPNNCSGSQTSVTLSGATGLWGG
jgi:hypothetical protein